MQLGAGVLGPGQAAAAEADGRHLEVAAVLLHQQVGGRLGDAEQRVGRGVDRHRGVDALVVAVGLGQLQPLLQLFQRQPVRRVAVDLVGRAEDEGRLGAVGAGRLEQVEGAVGVDAEVGLRIARGPVVRGLGGGVDDQLDLRCRARRRSGRPRSRSRMSAFSQRNSGVRGDQPLGHVRGRGLGAEEARPHVVLDADDVEALGDEVPDRLGADQAPRARDDRNRHSLPTPSPPPGRRCSSAWAIRSSSAAIHSWMSDEHLLGAAPRAPLVQAEELRAIGKVYGHVAGARLGDRLDRNLVAGQLAADLGRLQQREAALAAAADVDRAPVPALGVEQLALDQVDQVLDVEQVADLLALAAEADVAERAAEVVGEHPVGEDALVDLAHLPGPGDHAAAVDHRRHARGRRGTPRSAARRRAWSPRRGCGRRSSGTPREIPAGETPGNLLLGGDLEPGRRLAPARGRPAARPGRPGWSRGRRRRRRRGARARGSCRRRSGWCGRGRRCRRRRRSSPRARPSTRPAPRSPAARSRSSGSRTSPRTNSTPASSRRGRFSSEPAPVEVVEREDLPARGGARRARPRGSSRRSRRRR